MKSHKPQTKTTTIQGNVDKVFANGQIKVSTMVHGEWVLNPDEFSGAMVPAEGGSVWFKIASTPLKADDEGGQ